MRIAFLGTPHAAVPSLLAFINDPEFEIVAVITNPDRPQGRGYKLTPPPVKVAALEHGLPVFQPEKPADMLQTFADLNVDAAAVVAYGSLLKKDFLAAGGKGFVNLHYSILPAWRGAAPVTHSMWAGEKTTGVTCFLLDKGMDSGDVIATKTVEVLPQETAGELTNRLSDLGAPVLVEAVRSLINGTATLTKQDHDKATFASKISRDLAKIDWSMPANRVEDTVLAFNPMPGAHTMMDGKSVKIHLAQHLQADQVLPEQAEVTHTPGQVVPVPGKDLVVACGENTLLEITSIQPAGKPRMDAKSFVNGYAPTTFGEE